MFEDDSTLAVPCVSQAEVHDVLNWAISQARALQLSAFLVDKKGYKPTTEDCESAMVAMALLWASHAVDLMSCACSLV